MYVFDIKEALISGPVVAYIDSGSELIYYSDGIFDGVCSTRYDHGVSVVGWGVEKDVEYWIIRNSWNTWWGENGTARIKIDGNCNIYPISQAIIA